MKTKRSKNFVALAAVILMIVVACFLIGGRSDLAFEVERVPVQMGSVTKTVTATGTVQPLNKVEVGTQVSGEVEKIYVDYNSKVEKGQLLAELDKTNLLAVLQQAQANYDNALNEKNYYDKLYKRQKDLREQEVISQADFDQAEYQYNNAKSAVTQAYADLQQAQTNLSYADIYSPINGVVLSKEVDEGQTVAASFETPTLFTIARDLREMQVEADVDEADIGNVREGQRVNFTVDAFRKEIFNGTITQVRLNPSENESVITYTVVIKADNPEQKLKPGLTATVEIFTLELNNVLTVEAKALNFKPDPMVLQQYRESKEEQAASGEGLPSPPASGNRAVVWRYGTDGSISPQQITIGASDGVNVQVVEGLQEKEELVHELRVLEEEEAAIQGGSPFMPKPPGSR